MTCTNKTPDTHQFSYSMLNVCFSLLQQVHVVNILVTVEHKIIIIIPAYICPPARPALFQDAAASVSHQPPSVES